MVGAQGSVVDLAWLTKPSWRRYATLPYDLTVCGRMPSQDRFAGFCERLLLSAMVIDDGGVPPHHGGVFFLACCGACMNPIPVTLLTGFLGAGKTTLLNHILRGAHGQKIAVIENEFGPVNIDSALLIHEASEVIEMTNGCLCCTIRGDLDGHLRDLHARRAAGELAFDRLVIETTGLADPTPITQTFFASDALIQAYRLDGVIAVVDALHAPAQLAEHAVVRRQIGFADRVLVSKGDLVDEQALAALSARLARINLAAGQYRLAHGEVDLSLLFDLRGFHLDDSVLAAPAAHPAQLYQPALGASRPAFRAPAPAQSFADDIAALHLHHPGALDMLRISAFMNQLMEQHGDALLRHKGVLAIAGEPRRLIFQGVHKIAGFDYGREWGDEAPRSDIVLIGRSLPEAALRAGFAECVAG